ncbi:MAG: glycosyltransferase family 4 protein [Nitrospinae bacterium]|nr:glycosyltransferase family 4 protein [Nitrospinota bacterium]
MKVSFVIPFYGVYAKGGAETLCRRLAENLVLRGVDVEVLTTTIRDFTSHWNQLFYDPGIYNLDGVTIRRFNPHRVNTDVFGPINHRIIKRDPISSAEEVEYMANAVHSDALYSFIGDNHHDRLYFFLPYLFGTSLKGSSIVPNKSFLIPCLHDEGYAYLDVTRKMFARVSGALFNSKAEMRLANRIYGGLPLCEQAFIGVGVDRIYGPDPKRFREKYKLGDSPFILYAGRRDATKNTPTLIEYFARYSRMYPNSGLKLVLIGPGEVTVPDDVAGNVMDLGFVPLDDKKDAYSAATVLCQPSLNESFSLVMMESWLMERPVLVHSGCEVTKESVDECGGGFSFANFPEFAESVGYLLENPSDASEMGRRGRRYVLENFTWDIVCGRFKRFLSACEGL